MKKILCLFICLFTFSLMFGDSQAILNNYFNNPSPENIKAVIDEAHITKNVTVSNLNLLLVHYNEMNRAINSLEEVVEDLQPAQRFQLANTYLSLGKNKEAISHYDFLNENFANWSCPWRHKGEAYYNLEEWKQAEKALEMAIETRVEHYDAYLWLARVQLKLKKKKEALKTFETAMSYKGKDIEDPEEEFSTEEEKFLKLEILKANKKKKEYKELNKTLKDQYPNSEYWGK